RRPLLLRGEAAGCVRRRLRALDLDATGWGPALRGHPPLPARHSRPPALGSHLLRVPCPLVSLFLGVSGLASSRFAPRQSEPIVGNRLSLGPAPVPATVSVGNDPQLPVAPLALLVSRRPVRALGPVVAIIAGYLGLHYVAYMILRVPPYHWYYVP